MDPVFLQLLIGVAVNALSGVVGKSWIEATTMDVEGIVSSAAEELVAGEGGREGFLEEAPDFLVSPEATTFVRMLFMAGAHAPGPDTNALRSSFAKAYKRYAPEADDDEARALFELLATSSEKILQEAARVGDAEATEAMAAGRFRRLDEEIQGLRRAVEALDSVSREDVEAYLEWERVYRDQVLIRHGTITPPSFDASERVPVDDIYVEPEFLVEGDKDVADERLSRDELVASVDRTVVLGDPGAGKSTFAQKLAYDLARERAKVPGGSLTPLVVSLKDYGEEKRTARVSLVEWMEAVARTDYAAPPPEGAIPYLLSAGRVVVILDGLDELLDTSYRQEITADIETFAARFAVAPVVVTSRRVGYAQAPLDRRRYRIAHLTELDDDRVERYVEMWFGLRDELTAGEQQEMASNFMRDSAAAARDLRSNMLMLALLCNIYRGDHYIPQYRPQVYEKCAVMLFERWDRGRRIEVQLEFERHLRPAMQHLAFWIYSQPSLRDGVRETDLIRASADYLIGRRFEDEDAARQEAKRFVEFCRGRAWVFTDMGTTADGEGLYKFTHRTFLEFFAAEHLVRTYATPAELGEVLRPRIQRGEWDVVAELAFQLQDDNVDGAGDTLLLDLLADAPDDEVGDASFGFAARTLSFLVPRRQTCRVAAQAITRRTFGWLRDRIEYSLTADQNWLLLAKAGRSEGPPEDFISLVHSNRENLAPLAEAVLEETVALLEADRSLVGAEAALEIAPNVDMAIGTSPMRLPATAWHPIQAPALERMWPILREHLGESDEIAFDGVFFGLIDLEGAVSARSVGFLFESRSFHLYGNFIRSPLASLALRRQLGFDSHLDDQHFAGRIDMEVLGRSLFESAPPWDRSNIRHGSGFEDEFESEPIDPRDPDLEGYSLFAGFALLAALTEYATHREQLDILFGGLRAAEGWPRLLLPWLERRHEVETDGDLPPLPMDEKLRDSIMRWGEKDWSVVLQDYEFEDEVR